MTYDCIVVGGGHNGLVAAAYLSRAGRRVLVLERLDDVGGAAVSARAFAGVDARLSRYSYLVSLLPRQIIDDLAVPVRLQRRRYSSYTPDPAAGGRSGLLIGRDDDFAADFYRRCSIVTQALWPTMTGPLLSRRQARAMVGDDASWSLVVDEPIGYAIEAAVPDDLSRGVIATDALIGTFARLRDEPLVQNVCFLYHLLGGGTGDWDVPIGGMGAVTGALASVARGFGAEIVTGACVVEVSPDGVVRYRSGDDEHVVNGRFVLANVTPSTLAGLLGSPAPDSVAGSQVKVNLMLHRLPRLRDESVSAEAAFGGTFHINETYDQLDAAYSAAASGAVPDPLPCEIYCHSLSDPSILSPQLRASGAHTLTVFGLHTPHGLGDRDSLTSAVLASLDSVLAEPIQSVIMDDAEGRPCIETKTTADLEQALGMTAGHIFHGGLAWPFADDDESLDTPARRWGVATEHDRILLCGSSSRRGGGVSGLGGHSAAMAVLES